MDKLTAYYEVQLVIERAKTSYAEDELGRTRKEVINLKTSIDQLLYELQDERARNQRLEHDVHELSQQLIAWEGFTGHES